MIPSTLLGKWEGEEGTSLRNSRNCATVDDEQSTVTSHNGTSGPESYPNHSLHRLAVGKVIQYLSANDDLWIHNDIVISTALVAGVPRDLIATMQPRRVSRDFKTSPMRALPSWFVIW